MGNAAYCVQYYTVACCCPSWGYDSQNAYLEDEDPVTGCFPRSLTADISNDPRVFMGNVIEKRLGAFETIVIASILLAGTSAAYLLETEVNLDKLNYFGAGYISTLLMAVVFLFNMLCVLVLTLQYYQVFRLMTSGPTGFESSKDYYTTPTIMELRHTAVRMFTVSLPVFIVAIAMKICDRYTFHRAIPVLVYLSVVAFCCVIVMGRLNSIFVRMYAKCKRYEHLHFMEVDARAQSMKTAASRGGAFYTQGY